MLKPLVIRNLKLSSNLILAPMAQITNYPLRKILLLRGADLVISEMVSSKSIFYGNKKSLSMIKVLDDRPLCIQIFGGDVESMVYAASVCQENGADMIEINAGCPVKKVVKAGGGIGLFSQPKKLGSIVYEISKRITIPLSVKMRLGIKSPNECIEVARICQENGADVIHIHMRMLHQMHSGEVDFRSTLRLKESLKIPIIANGGIRTPLDALKTFNETKADAISIAQGSIINPFIFEDIKRYLADGSLVERGVRERVRLLIDYLNLSLTKYGEKETLQNSRRLVGMWLSNFPWAARWRDSYMRAKDIKEAFQILNDLIEKL